jgi:hypothetical protein
VEVIMDGVMALVDVSFAELGATHQCVAFFRPNLRMDKPHDITIRIIENDDGSMVLYHVGFM